MKNKVTAICILFCGIFFSVAAVRAAGHPPAGSSVADPSLTNRAAAPKSNGFTVTGYITGLKDPYVYLQWKIGDSTHNDSTAVKNGTFRFAGKVDGPVMAYFFTKRKYTQFFLENSVIRLRGNIDSIDDLRVTGSVSQHTYDSLQASLNDLKAPIEKLYGQYNTARANKDSTQQTLLEGRIDSLEGLETQRTQAFIRTHSQSPVSLSEIEGMFYAGDYDTLQALYSGLDRGLQQTSLGKSVAKKLDILRRTAPGQQAMDFTQSNMDGQAVQFSAYNKGRYVLLDFWASWCGPCRGENPNVLKAYNEFKDKNFVVLGVSLDENGQKWKEAVAKDGMPWTQLSDLKGWKNEAARQYGIQGIPANFLVGPDGIIIAKNLRGPALQKKLAEILETKAVQ